ncbi:hypothetical protein ACJJTC_009251, partial [Scirpophaga incertulas]
MNTTTSSEWSNNVVITTGCKPAPRPHRQRRSSDEASSTNQDRKKRPRKKKAKRKRTPDQQHEIQQDNPSRDETPIRCQQPAQEMRNKTIEASLSQSESEGKSDYENLKEALTE